MSSRKAVSFGEVLEDEFKTYAQNVISNAKRLAESLNKEGIQLVSGGTDNHLVLVDLRSLGLTGKVAEHVLDEIGITSNKTRSLTIRKTVRHKRNPSRYGSCDKPRL